MKYKIIFITLILITINNLKSQKHFSSSVEKFRQELIREYNKDNNFIYNTNFKEQYPIHKHNGVYFVSVLAEKNVNYSKSKLEKLNIIVGSEIGNFLTMRIPLSLFKEKLELEGINYIEIANRIHRNLDRALKDAKVDSVHFAWLLQQPFTGKNVLIGVTDWGFDYTHPMFYDTSLTETRIVAAWDQFRNQGPAPLNFNYGTEFIGEQQLLNAQTDTFNIYQYSTHGTHVAGIAGGSGAGTQFRGVAFDAEFLFATFLIDAAAVIDAFYWMKNYAQSVGKRLVINTSWGLYYMGNLDGTSILSQIIDQMSNEGVVFVSSAGNNGDVDFHIKRNFTSQTDTMRTIIGFDSYAFYPNMWGQSITMWGSTNSSFQFSLKILNNQNIQVAETPFFSTNNNVFTEDSLIVGNDTIRFNFVADSSNYFNQRPHVRLRVQNRNTALKTALFLTSAQSTVHLWNVIELTNGVGNWGSPFYALNANWTAGDRNYGIGEPACTKSVISVAAHTAEFRLPNGNLTGGNIASFSSFGPTIDDRIKPDISAPGVNVASSLSSFTTQNLSNLNIVANVDFKGRNYKFARFSGTSMSAPMISGIVALMLEANPNLTPLQVKNIIMQTAREDSKTGTIPPMGSTRWGKGKVNALNAIYQTLGILLVDENHKNHKLKIFPNPANDIITIENYLMNNYKIYFIDSHGKIVYHSTTSNDNKFNISHLESGKYIVVIKTTNKNYVGSFIKL